MIKGKLFNEIFEEFQNCKTRPERIELLRKYDHPGLRDFFVASFSPNVKLNIILPETYRPAIEPAGLNYSYLEIEMSRIYRFVEGHPQKINVPEKKMKQIVTGILECLHKDEARLFVKMVQQKLDIKFLTAALVKEAFPDIPL